MILWKLENSDHQLQFQLHKKRLQYIYIYIAIVWFGLFGITPHLSRFNFTNKTCKNQWNLSGFHQNHCDTDNHNLKSVTYTVHQFYFLRQADIYWPSFATTHLTKTQKNDTVHMGTSHTHTHTHKLSTWANDWQWKEPMMVASKATMPPRLRTLRRLMLHGS